MGTSVGVEELEFGVSSSSVGRGVEVVPLAGRVHDVNIKAASTIQR
jgi:hypothetical protein